MNLSKEMKKSVEKHENLIILPEKTEKILSKNKN